MSFYKPYIEYHFQILHHVAQRSKIEGLLILAAFGENLPPRVKHFEIGDLTGMTEAAMAFQDTGYNVYAPLAIFRADLEKGKKGSEEDIVAVLGAVIDGDADKGKAAPEPPVAANYMTETSPGNHQHFLFFDEALSKDEAKPMCEALQRATGADCAGDICHVWRVPGTLNYPTAGKIKRGRSPEPFLVGIPQSGDTDCISVDHLRSVLQPHWEKPRPERAATAAGQIKYDNDPDKCEAFLIRLRDAGYFDKGEDARRRYIRAAKACSYDLGEEAGRPIWERVVCWQGKREDEGESASDEEKENRWKDCSSLKPGVKAVTFGSLVDDARKLYGWKGSEIHLRRDKTSAEMFEDARAHLAQVKSGEAPLQPAQAPPSISSANIVPQPEQPTAPVVPITQNAANLLKRHFAEVRYVIPGYIAEGCTILAGKPKIGKSWFVLDGGLAVAGGNSGRMFGRRTEQGNVLYLALEDNERRLKSRIKKVLGPLETGPERFEYRTEWPRADQGGLEAIEVWIKSVPKATLIIVDVLARFRPMATGRNTAAYDADYAAISGLQGIASKYDVAIVIVHHLRKNAQDNDPFDKVSGTLGLSGAADTILILDRDGQGVTLYGRGRDIEEIETAVQFDKAQCRWIVLGSAGEVRQSSERKTILEVLKGSPTAMSPADIAAETGMKAANVKFLLRKLSEDGKVMKPERGKYLLDLRAPLTSLALVPNSLSDANSSVFPSISISNPKVNGQNAATHHSHSPPMPPGWNGK